MKSSIASKKIQTAPAGETKKVEIKEDHVLIEIPERKKETGREMGKKKSKTRMKKSWVMVSGILIFIFLLLVGILLINHKVKVNWALTKALPEIEKLYNELKMPGAFNLVQNAEKYIGKDQNFKLWASRVITKVKILSDPPGAEVFIREYSDLNGEWKRIGTTPIYSVILPVETFYQAKMQKEGYENILAVFYSMDTLKRNLFKAGTIPTGMVYVGGYWDGVTNTFLKNQGHGFFLDRFEVTNRQYKEFADNGGYSNPVYWKNDFIKNGKNLTWEEAIAEFTDKTGRPGPAGWEAGDYPDGQDDYPVSGVSWYEAAAYAEFAGKSLPTADHWYTGAGLNFSTYSYYFGSRISPLSNFSGKGTEPVGKHQGITCFGAFDMAGNVREWCWNETKSGRIIAGAGYEDATYLFSSWNQLLPFDRSLQNGLRCVKYIDKQKIPERAFRPIESGGGIDYTKELPVPEIIFRSFKNQFLYDKIPLNAVIEERDENSTERIIEKISFTAAYGHERMIAYLYLPKNSSPPFQTLIYFPGSQAVWEKEIKKSSGTNRNSDFILKSGRAVMFPVYKGTYERNDGLTREMRVPNPSHQYTEWLIKWVKDFSRSIDYLETREEIETDNLGFYGASWGGVIGGIIPAVEDRLKVNILCLGGYGPGGRAFPEAFAVNYVPRIKIPTLMLNGRYDSRFPYEINLMPFFNSLGTPEKDKRLCLYETDHFLPRSEWIKEILAWLDKYFGPVKPLK